MRAAVLGGVAAVLVLLAAGAAGRAAVAAGGSAVTPGRAAQLGAQAYRYGFPLLEFLRVRSTETSVRCPDGAGDAPVNSFSNAPRFARPSDRTVVAPNVDTLYSIAHLDLTRGPVVLSHPAMGRRYFVFELVDPYTNVIGYVGTRTTGAGSGQFAITWTRHPGRRVPGARVIRSAYRQVWVIGRTLAGNRADQRRALALMRQYQLSPPGGPRRFARGCRPGKPVKAVTPTGLPFLDRLNAVLAQNPPPSRDRPLLRRLAAVGVGPGLSVARAGLSPAALTALVSGVDQAAAALPTDARLAVLQSAKRDHGWFIPASIIGHYGTDYLYRAETASVGLGANTPREAVYPTALTDAAGQLLSGARSYRLVFGARRFAAGARVLVADHVQRLRLPGGQPRPPVRDRFQSPAAAPSQRNRRDHRVAPPAPRVRDQLAARAGGWIPSEPAAVLAPPQRAGRSLAAPASGAGRPRVRGRFLQAPIEGAD